MGWYRLNSNLAIYQPGDYRKINSFFWAFVYWSTDLCFWIATYIMPRIWLIYANIQPCLPPWLTLFAFPDIFPVWNEDGHPVVSAFFPRCGPAPRQIVRSRDLIFSLTCSGSLFVSWIVEANCILCDVGSILLWFYVALLQQGLLCWHTLPYGNDFGWYGWQPCLHCCLCVPPCPPRPVLKQFRPGRFYPHCSKHLFHSPSLCLFLLRTQLVSYLYV